MWQVVQHLKKTPKILLFVFTIGAIFSIGFLIFGIIAVQDKYEPENIQQIENKNLQVELENKYVELKNYFGEENIQIDYAGASFNEIRITHIPTGIIVFGNEHKTQLKNAILALEKLKLEIEK